MTPVSGRAFEQKLLVVAAVGTSSYPTFFLGMKPATDSATQLSHWLVTIMRGDEPGERGMNVRTEDDDAMIFAVGACVNLGSRALFAPIARSFNATATVAFANSATAIGGRPPRISIFARRVSTKF